MQYYVKLQHYMVVCCMCVFYYYLSKFNHFPRLESSLCSLFFFLIYQIGWVILYSIVVHALCLWSLSRLSWPADGQQGDGFL